MEYVADAYASGGLGISTGALASDSRSMRTPAPDGYTTPATTTTRMLCQIIYYKMRVLAIYNCMFTYPPC